MVGANDVRPPKRTRRAVGRQTPVIEEVLGIEEHPTGRAHRRRQLGVEGLGGQDVAAYPEDAPPQPGHRPALRGSVGGDHHLPRSEGPARRLDLVPRRLTDHPTGIGVSVQFRSGDQRGACQSPGQLGRLQGAAARHQETAGEACRADFGPEVLRRHEPGLLPDGRVGVRHRTEVGDVPGMARQLEMTAAAPVTLDAQLGDEDSETFEGGHRVVPHGRAPVHGEHGGQIVFASRMGHAAVAGARPPADLVAVDDDDVTLPTGKLPRRGQARVAAADDDDIRLGGQRCARRTGRVDPNPPVGGRFVVRGERCRGRDAKVRTSADPGARR